MATIVVLIVGILALSAAMVSSAKCQAASRERLAVSRALSNQLELIGEAPYDTIPARYNAMEFEIPGVARVNPAHPPGRVEVTVKDWTLLEVKVTGTWKGLYGNESVELFQEFAR